eukprot:2924312-Pleurochrysis_carterae.AAC.1
MTMLCSDNDDDVLQSPAMIVSPEVSSAVNSAASATALRRERRQRPGCSDGSGAVRAATTA